jgi:predicted short-subunit dehydrogenase-like oxidoreductase (DUF2520 family)
MRIALIGTGNVATVLGKIMKERGHTIVQVAGRTQTNVLNLASSLGATGTGLDKIGTIETDLFVIAVSDAALSELANTIHVHPVPVVHTAGSVSMDVLLHTSSHIGVLYPLQSLRKEMPVLPEIPFLIDGNSVMLQQKLLEFGKTLSDQCLAAGDEHRLRLHTAAVFVSNFTNHLYAMGEDFCIKEGVDFNLLKPLIYETAARLKYYSPSAVQTGPAVRKDIQTLDKHLRLLNAHPKLRTTYLRMTDSIMNP